MALFGNRIIAVIPARGGSKSILKKNLRKICGKSLINHAADICNALPWIDLSIISTDDMEMAEEGRNCGLMVPFMRPAYLSSDSASSVDMWKDAWIKSEQELNDHFDISILLEPTSPLRKPIDIENCLLKMIKNNYEGVATVSLMPAHFRPEKALRISEDGKIEFYLPNDKSYLPRQKIPPYYYRNGICYAISRQKLLDENTIMDESIHAMLIEREVVNIDEPFDLELAEFILKRS